MFPTMGQKQPAGVEDVRRRTRPDHLLGCRTENWRYPAPSGGGAQQAWTEAKERDAERRGFPSLSVFTLRTGPSQNSGQAIAINLAEARSDPKIRKQRREGGSLWQTATRLQQGRARWRLREPRLLVA